MTENVKFKLNDIYKLYGYKQKFNEFIEEIKGINWEDVDSKTSKKFIENFSFIFNIEKKSDPISYPVFYVMQYTFWQVVIVGGLLTNKKLSARLLEHALTLFGKEPEDMIIEDEETIQTIKEDEVFNNRIKTLIRKYGEEKDKFTVNVNSNEEDKLLSFENNDLLYALHNATLILDAKKNEYNKWNLDVEIIDTYDFKDFKKLEEYVDSKKSKIADILSTTLNNLGVISSEYGVLKIYDLKIKFIMNNIEK